MSQHVPTTITEGLSESAREYVSSSRSKATRTAYRTDWARFEGWCAARGAAALPASPALVANYLADHASTHRASTLGRWACSIAQAHKAAGAVDPTKGEAVRLTMEGIRAKHGSASAPKAALVLEDVHRVCLVIPPTLAGVRDRALLLVGWACGLRRSELVAIQLEHLREVAGGMVLRVPKSKTDQAGAGADISIEPGSNLAACPVAAVRMWRAALVARGVVSGPLFRGIDRHGHVDSAALSDCSVAYIVKRLVESVGLDPKSFAGHSLRRGMATSAAAAGIEERDIQRRGRWKSERVMRKYVEEGQLFANPAGRML